MTSERPSRFRFHSVGLVARVLLFAAVLHFLVLPQIGGTGKALRLIAGLDPLLVVGALVLAAIPLSRGRLGVIEAALIVTLVGFGSPRGVASLGVAGYRVVPFWVPIPAGAAAWAGLVGGRSRGAIRAMAEHARPALREPTAR